MFGKLKRNKARAAVAQQANRMEMLEDRRLMTVSNVQVSAPTSVDEGSTFLLEFSAQTDGEFTHWVIDVGDGPITVGGETRSLWVNFIDGDATLFSLCERAI